MFTTNLFKESNLTPITIEDKKMTYESPRSTAPSIRFGKKEMISQYTRSDNLYTAKSDGYVVFDYSAYDKPKNIHRATTLYITDSIKETFLEYIVFTDCFIQVYAGTNMYIHLNDPDIVAYFIPIVLSVDNTSDISITNSSSDKTFNNCDFLKYFNTETKRDYTKEIINHK